MIKISAFNVESEEESSSEEEITKEALQQIALQQYTKALDLHKKGNISEATQLLKDLLDTELLYDVKKTKDGETVSGPLFNLKYLCYKNLASMLNAAGETDAAIEAYTAASELDDTDVTLWYRLGLVCFQGKHYEMALHAFQKGIERNPRHWPCLDKIIILLLGLNYKEQCLATIHDALQLDPDYLRGIVYRRHIYTVYRHMREYMECINPIYKWNEEDEPIDEEKALKLLKEAEDIHESFIEQQKAETFKYMVPNLKLNKPITRLCWASVGESLVHMHKHMTKYCFSHACFIEIIYEKESEEVTKMDVCEELKSNSTESKEEDTTDKNTPETVADSVNNDLSDKEKPVTDNEKVESDIEMVPSEPVMENVSENKVQKKTSVRRRGSALISLEPWEWCKRKSNRKKPVKDTIYDTLRKMVPIALVPEIIQMNENQEKETSPEISDLNKLFEEKEKGGNDDDYFGTESEQKDVKSFINKYTENNKDIIDMLNDYINILAEKWRLKWPEDLLKIYAEANKCYRNHVDIPACTDENHQCLVQYTLANMLTEEIIVNEKLNIVSDEVPIHDLNVIESIEVILTLKPNIYPSIECLEMILRSLWLKLHIHILNKCEDLALECLYQLLSEFEAMGEHHDTYSLNLINFNYKPDINENEILEYITFLERNKKLSTVMDLYNQGNYEEVLSIIIESFDHCKTIAREQEEEMCLDFAVQLSLILDTYWALDKVECCFKWTLTCLHEALKHYFRYTSGSSDYEKWNLTVIKILKTMEHILATEGLACIETVTQKELSRGLEDLIRIIGHQVETKASDMPFDTVSPWIIMHYILQREEDQGRSRPVSEKDAIEYCDEVPNPLKVLFIAHDQLGAKHWCCKSDAKLLFFILDTVVPRLRSPSLAKSLEQINQYMEQCVFCLYGHKGKKKNYLKDHQATHLTLDWQRAQQLYEIFRPTALPELSGKLSAISADIETLFNRILSLLPSECDPSKYVVETEKYIKGTEDKLPLVPPLLPYKMKDIYFLLGDYHFKKEDYKMSIKYNTFDVVINNDRFISWAHIALAKAANLGNALKLYKNFNSEREFLNPAKSTIRCFKRSLELDTKTSEMWREYGNFVYIVHSFCSRLLKQASESLSMESFEALEKQKEDLLETTHKCFSIVEDLNRTDVDKSNEDNWLLYYMLGKVAEKQNKPPFVYLKFYLKGIRSLQEVGATYPTKINYNTPTHLSIKVLELHYRMHASILKYIEQHENKPIPLSVGKVFLNCIEEWQEGPFTRKPKKHNGVDNENEPKMDETQSIQAANILKRSVSDAGEDDTHEAKRLKMEAAAAKVRRSASYDTEHIGFKDSSIQNEGQIKDTKEITTIENVETNTEKDTNAEVPKSPKESDSKSEKPVHVDKKEETSSSSSSSSSSDSNSSESSSSSSSSSSGESDTSSKSSEDSKPLTDEEIMKIVSSSLDALEDCASRYTPHYKALYRLAHYHFYYKKGRDIERCRDLMLSTFISRSGHKMNGLFSERRNTNFFNNIWTMRNDEVARPGGFAFHMNRSVLLTLEILKEIDDHKTLLDLSLHLQRTPELDKKYLRDSDREDLAQQALSLCVQSLRGQLVKFSQQADLKSNEVERQALKSLMVDIYKAHQRAQKQLNSKQFTNLLVDAYKLISATPIAENVNLVEVSMKYCHSLLHTHKQQGIREANLEKTQNLHKKQSSKSVDSSKVIRTTTSQPKTDTKSQNATSGSGLPKISAHEMAAAFQNYVPMLNDPVLSQQAAAALSLSYLSNISALAGYTSYQNSLTSSIQTSLQNSFQAEFYRQFLGQSLSSYNMPQQKKKRGPKPSLNRSVSSGATQMKTTKPYSATTSVTKATPTPVITSLQKSTSNPITPSMGTVLSSLPASMTANLSSFGAKVSHANPHSVVPQAHMSTASTVSTSMHSKPPMPHQQVSPGKTLQEKLAERQKSMPSGKNAPQEISASISRLPPSLTITKTSVSKHPSDQGKKPEAKKSLSFSEIEVRPKPISSDEVIVLDDD
ncbi:calcineurin-binding protein cabin-1-like [Vanessa cardui]|uniref:calcineurin-binding protein cabin-1-like n=1 Tax=Vanessa cardui TaxID=171605 RepID=UPI001F135761|nr:calcineurin-binding protein cabin-1-like [Vanessa cardui]